jgi:hypothetical protein
VQLPSFDTTPSDIDRSGLGELKDVVKKLLNSTIQLNEELTFLLNNLDTRNINEINADIINAGTINAALVKIQTALMNGGFISIDDQGFKINDGTDDTMTAGLDGKVKMTGAEIRSKMGYPAVVMDPEKDLFGAYTDTDRRVQIEAVNVSTGSPRILVANPDGSISIYQQSNASNVFTYNSKLRLISDRDIDLSPGTFYNVIVPFDQLRDFNGGVSLDGKLAQKATAGVSTGLSGSHNHGIPDGTVLRTADGGTVTFFAAGSHSHAQN